MKSAAQTAGAIACPARQAARHERGFAGNLSDVAGVRRFLRQVLDGSPAAGDAVMCGSELAANAVLHSRSGRPGGTFTVACERHRGHVRIDVADQGGPWPDRPAARSGESWHGLDIVRGLSAATGVAGDEAGRVVWCRIDLPPADGDRP